MAKNGNGRKFLHTTSRGAKVSSVKIGRVWTFITLKLPTDRLALQSVKAHFGKTATVIK